MTDKRKAREKAKAVAKTWKARRLKLGISQRKLAWAAGVSVGAYQHWEWGMSAPRPCHLESVENFLTNLEKPQK